MSCGQIALERAGIKVNNYFASEIDQHAIKVTQHNYPNTIQLGDVRNWRDWKLPKIDLIIGGSPCQGFSFSGKCLNFDDPRSKLFFEFAEIVKYYRPKHFLLENVKMKKESMNVITEYMGVEPIGINSALVSAQNRVRNYWTNIPNVTQPYDQNIYIDDILDGYVAAVRGRYIGNTGKTAQFLECRKDRKSNTLTTVSKDNVVVKEIIYEKTLAKDVDYRYLTPNECEQLQTVPINYTECVSDSQRMKLLGNGWTVDIISHIFKGLKD